VVDIAAVVNTDAAVVDSGHVAEKDTWCAVGTAVDCL
jgi:hypothetical protein